MDAARPPLPLRKAGLAEGCASSSGPAPVRSGCSCPMNFYSPHAVEPCPDCSGSPGAGQQAGRRLPADSAPDPHLCCQRRASRAAPAPTFPVGAEQRQNQGKTLRNEPFC